MSTTQDVATANPGIAPHDAPSAGTRRRMARRMLLGGAALGVTAALASAALLGRPDARPVHAPSATPTESPSPHVATDEEIANAKAAPMTYATQQGMTQNIPMTVVYGGSVKKNRHTVKIVSAKADLTGISEMRWPADAGTPVGDAHCTQMFRFSKQAGPAIKPTMMMCWRTSKTKSAYAIVVKFDEKPSDVETAKLVDDAWAKLG